MVCERIDQIGDIFAVLVSSAHFPAALHHACQTNRSYFFAKHVCRHSESNTALHNDKARIGLCAISGAQFWPHTFCCRTVSLSDKHVVMNLKIGQGICAALRISAVASRNHRPPSYRRIFVALLICHCFKRPAHPWNLRVWRCVARLSTPVPASLPSRSRRVLALLCPSLTLSEPTMTCFTIDFLFAQSIDLLWWKESKEIFVSRLFGVLCRHQHGSPPFARVLLSFAAVSVRQFKAKKQKIPST